MKSDRPYLEHIAASIAAIESYVTGGRDAFMREPMIRDAVIRNFSGLVWDVIEHQLPQLKAAVVQLLGLVRQQRHTCP